MKTFPALFDANGPVGHGARSRGEFPTCADLLRHMDRLGIARSLVWSIEGRDHNPPAGNARLLAQLKRLGAQQRKRLFPSLVVAPTMLFAREPVNELTEMMRTENIRALRVFPSTLRHKMRHIEPLIEKVAYLKPVLFVDVHEVTDDAEILSFAEKYPTIPVVMMHGMWPHIFNFSLLDLMRRRPNILIDNSWQHCRDVTEHVVENFGPDRILFATGLKAHNGAAISGLLHADLAPAVRDQIAHGNLERLLGLKDACAPKAPRASGKKTLWKTFCDTQHVNHEIIDAHGHLGSQGLWAMKEAKLEDQIAAALGHMDSLGIRKIVVSGLDALFAEPVEGNLLLEQAASPHSKRIQGYLAFNPVYADALTRRLDDFFSRKFFVGFKFLCDYWQVPVTDKRFEPALRYANDHRLPILSHTWEGPWNSPAMLKDIAKAYPKAFFLLGHSGGGDGGRREAIELARECPNVYLEWCGSFCSGVSWEETIEAVGCDRVVFGSDALIHDFAWELGRLLSVDLPDEKIIPILAGNMKRILRMRR